MEEPVVGEWARTKLEFLSKYLAAYTRILSKRNFRYVYIDAFAGAGHARIRSPEITRGALFPEISDPEQRDYLIGSPRAALNIEPPFTRYVFVELDPERVRFLGKLKGEFRETRNIVIRQEDCNDYLLKTVPNIDWRKYRAVVFLDPFGMQVPWSTIEALAKTRGIEVFINFPLGMSIQRMLPRSGKFTSDQRRKMDIYFGTHEWYDVVYGQHQDLFGSRISKAPGEALVRWYRGRLQGLFGFVSKARLIRNSRGGHLYYLIFAGPNEVGAKIADHLLSAGEVIE